jgi:hypothetical protein
VKRASIKHLAFSRVYIVQKYTCLEADDKPTIFKSFNGAFEFANSVPYLVWQGSCANIHARMNHNIVVHITRQPLWN